MFSVFSFHQLGELPYRKNGNYNQFLIDLHLPSTIDFRAIGRKPRIKSDGL